MKIRTIALSLAAVPMLFAASSFAADSKTAAPATQARVIQIGELSNSNALKFTIKSDKASYAVGESIRLSVQGGRPYYLYLYNQQPDGSNVLLYPNKKEKSTLLPANKTISLPKLVRFFSDRAGTENITAIATTKPLSINPAQLKDAGDFSLANKGAVEAALSARQIQIGEVNNVPNPTDETVVRSLHIHVTAANNASNSTTLNANNRSTTDECRSRRRCCFYHCG